MSRIGPFDLHAGHMVAGGVLIAAVFALGATAIRPVPRAPAPVETSDVVAPDVMRAFFRGAPGASIRECTTCPVLALIPAGAFSMGGKYTDERPLRTVTFAAPFAMSQTEVTFDEWDSCVAARACSDEPSDAGWGRGDRPVINVTPREAEVYAAWLSARTGARYRLPTEAEWEYAARAGATGEYPWGDEIGANNANCIGCGGASDRTQGAPKGSLPVGSFPANAWGLKDTSGNVFEWTADCYHPTYDGAPTDGSAWTAACKENSRVARGGAWSFDIASVRAAFRMNLADGVRGGYVGFRVVREAS